MKTRNLDTLKNKLMLPLLIAGMALANYASAQTTIAQWTFDSLASTFSYKPGVGVVTTNFYADGGTQAGIAALTGYHSGYGGSTYGAYSSPTGNPGRSLSSNGWTNDPGDYYQIVVNTTGFTNITLAVQHYSSGTGPRDFTVQYSTDGSTFSSFTTYTAGSSAWSSYNFDLSSITALANASTVYFRLTDNSNTSANGGTVGTSGASRIDNITVAGTISGPPQIVTQPADTLAYYGDTTSLTVLAGGDAPLTYQWYTNSTPATPLTDSGNMTGSISNSLTFSFVSTNQAGDYFVIVSNALNTATSSVVHLTVNVRTPIVTNIAYLRTLHDANFALTDTTNIYVVTGIVTTPINLVSGTTEVESFFMQDTNTGEGIDVFFRGGFPFPSQGNIVRVTAPLLQYQGLLEMAPVNGNPAHSVEILGSGTLPAPQYFDFTTLPASSNMEENIEGRYLVVSNVFIGVSAANAGYFSASGTVYLTNGLGKVFYSLVPNNPAIDIVGYPVPGGFAKSLRGVMSQAQSSGTVLTNFYSILLAQGADLEIGTPVTANPDFYTVNTNSTSIFSVLTNDMVLSPDPLNPSTLTVTAVSTTNGFASIMDGTNIVFTPDVDYAGTLTIGYTATDDLGYANDGTITVTVSPTAAAPSSEPITVQTESGKLVMRWTQATFSLAASTNVAGPYLKISGASSPYTNNTTEGTMFFKLVYP